MIPKPSKEKFTFIFHRENAAPKYFEIERAKLMTYMVVIPTGFLILFSGLFITSLLVHSTHSNAPSASYNLDLPSKATSSNAGQLQKEKEELEKNYKELQSANQELVNKLSTNSGKFSPPLQDLSLFTILPDQKDQSATPVMAVNEVKISEDGQELHFHANLLNTNSESSKISGHLFIVMKSENSVWVYPSDAFPKDKMSLNFSSGETVLFARLRPVDASFPKAPKGSKILFKVLLFSRTGDLLHKEVFPYDVK